MAAPGKGQAHYDLEEEEEEEVADSVLSKPELNYGDSIPDDYFVALKGHPLLFLKDAFRNPTAERKLHIIVDGPGFGYCCRFRNTARLVATFPLVPALCLVSQEDGHGACCRQTGPCWLRPSELQGRSVTNSWVVADSS